ncbi:hypothetical protein [Bradyrhizobium ganzhouense]
MARYLRRYLTPATTITTTGNVTAASSVHSATAVTVAPRFAMRYR